MARIIRNVIGPNTAVEEAALSGTDAEIHLLFEAATKTFERISSQRGTCDQSKAKTKAILEAAHTGLISLLIFALNRQQ